MAKLKVLEGQWKELLSKCPQATSANWSALMREAMTELRASEERVRVLEEALSDVYALDVYKLHPFACGHYMTIAILCDDYLDKSGALLGRVRERAKDKARQALGDSHP